MAFVLASQPVKHPNYPNKDHYAVLDTNDGIVDYVTLDEIKQYKKNGIEFIGNHSLANKDTKGLNRTGRCIIRSVCNLTLVYYLSSKKCIVENNNTHNLLISDYDRFREVSYRDELEPSVCGVGIVGMKNMRNSKYYFIYTIWRYMLERTTYSEYYIDVSLDSDWLFFPNFLEWYISQPNYTDDVLKILETKSTCFNIDKDILTKSRIYGSSFCTLVPKSLNVALTNSRTSRGIYPIGVSKNDTFCMQYGSHSSGGLTCISVNTLNNKENADYYRGIALQFKNIESIQKEEWAAVGYCFLQYKEQRESAIKRLAEYWYNYEYNGHIVHVITKECYDALMNWVVDIND